MNNITVWSYQRTDHYSYRKSVEKPNQTGYITHYTKTYNIAVKKKKKSKQLYYLNNDLPMKTKYMNKANNLN